MTLAERLELHFEPEPNSGCWLWTGSITSSGYGKIAVGGGNRALVVAHRAMYESLVGPVPDGADLDHLCRIRRCINPRHLDPVTRSINICRAYRSANRYGEHHHQARLTAVQVREIRERAPTESQHALAATYGVSQTSIGNILRGKTWSEIA